MIEDAFFALIIVGLGALVLAAVVGITAMFIGLVWGLVA